MPSSSTGSDASKDRALLDLLASVGLTPLDTGGSVHVLGDGPRLASRHRLGSSA